MHRNSIFTWNALTRTPPVKIISYITLPIKSHEIGVVHLCGMPNFIETGIQKILLHIFLESIIILRFNFWTHNWRFWNGYSILGPAHFLKHFRFFDFHILRFSTKNHLIHNFLNIDPILMKPAPIESPLWELSIGVSFAKIGAIWRILWAKEFGAFLKCKNGSTKYEFAIMLEFDKFGYTDIVQVNYADFLSVQIEPPSKWCSTLNTAYRRIQNNISFHINAKRHTKSRFTFSSPFLFLRSTS